MKLRGTEEQQNSRLRNRQQRRQHRQDRGLDADEFNEALQGVSHFPVTPPIAFTTVCTDSTCSFVVAACLSAMLLTCSHQ
jgi:hypothetical protein